VAAVALACLLISYLSESGALGFGTEQADLGDVVYLLVLASAAAIAIAGAWAHRDLGGWGLIGLGVAFWAIGEIYYFHWVDPLTSPYPSPADYLYFVFYLLVILGLRTLGSRAHSGTASFAVLITPILGLATAWSWLALGPVVGSLEGSTAARLTTIAYPFLDLLLVCSAVAALVALGWRAGLSLLLLICGIVLVGIADSVYAAQVTQHSVPDQTIIDPLWPTGALLIAAAPWMVRGSGASGGPGRGRMALSFALGAIGVALTVLIWDHFERFDTATVVLAGLTLVTAAAQLVYLYANAVKSRRDAVQARRERTRIEALHTASAEGALDSIITADADGRILDWNAAAERTVGHSREEAVGSMVSTLIVPPALRGQHEDALARLAAGGEPSLAGKRVELIGLRADGSEIPIELAIAMVAKDPITFTAFIRDISEDKLHEEERDRLVEMVHSAQDAMVSTSLDGIVLTWNPAAERIYGFKAAEIVGSPMRKVVPPDRIDLLRTAGRSVAAGQSLSLETTGLRKDGEIIDISLQVFPIRDQAGRVTGASTVTRDITDRRQREREQRVNRERDAWRSQIEEALDGDRFVFHAQPVLDLRSGRITHSELLLRMRMDDELVPPGAFLPHAEDSPLMRRIDRWAIGRGTELAAERPVAINLSATSVSETGTVAAVQTALDESGADPRDVTFEITETAAVQDLEAAELLVRALTVLGCGVALDDFGTGFGSFTYLMRLPVTSLKIDIDFIHGLTEDPDDQRVVRSIIAVAQNFGLSTVAEGVEDEQTFELVRAMNIDQAQGYLIGRPQERWTAEEDLAPGLISPRRK
jgi:PAS domain S-box-containing protein